MLSCRSVANDSVFAKQRATVNLSRVALLCLSHYAFPWLVTSGLVLLPLVLLALPFSPSAPVFWSLTLSTDLPGSYLGLRPLC